MATKYVSGRLVEGKGGVGGFLCPPGHPMHSVHVETDLRRKPENRGCMSLDYAATCEYLDPRARGAASGRLKRWQRERLPLESAEVQAWIAQVLGYFRGCYRNPNVEASKQWDASNLLIREWLPMECIEDHAGVRCVRKYYPEFVPTEAHFAGAYWGTKPEASK